MRALIFPTKKSALPNIGEAFAIVQAGNVLVKSKGVALLVCHRRVGVSKHFAQVNEMTLCGGALFSSLAFHRSTNSGSDRGIGCWVSYAGDS